MDPPCPLTLAPVESTTLPLAPLELVPVKTEMLPESACEAAVEGVATVTLPLATALLPPLLTVMEPPTASSSAPPVAPAVTTTEPPALSMLEPDAAIISPPDSIATPVDTLIDPLATPLLLPLPSLSIPLDPASPESAVDTSTSPEGKSNAEAPLTIRTTPPVLSELDPAVTETEAPASSTVVPAFSSIEPALAASPVFKDNRPVLAASASPDPTTNAPLADCSLGVALAEATVTEPEDERDPPPLARETEPPAPTALSPALT
jgi:hypothetical protein